MSFLNELENFVGKTKFQQYDITIFDKQYSVLVEYNKKAEFIEFIKENKPSNSDELKTILEKFNGQFE